MNIFTRFHLFWNFNNIKNILYIDVIIIAFKKSFKNLMLVILLELFVQNHKFEIWFEIFLGNVFPKVILKSFYFFLIKKKIE
jgi:transcription elongation factor GreA-like protein